MTKQYHRERIRKTWSASTIARLSSAGRTAEFVEKSRKDMMATQPRTFISLSSHDHTFLHDPRAQMGEHAEWRHCKPWPTQASRQRQVVSLPCDWLSVQELSRP